jgi:hypothetical protein
METQEAVSAQDADALVELLADGEPLATRAENLQIEFELLREDFAWFGEPVEADPVVAARGPADPR